jgi:hypothetical protein
LPAIFWMYIVQQTAILSFWSSEANAPHSNGWC